MTVRLTLRTPLPLPAIEGRLRDLAAAGPFRIRGLSHAGGDAWSVVLEPARPQIAVGFGKVAELVVLLARSFDVGAVGCEAERTLTATG